MLARVRSRAEAAEVDQRINRQNLHCPISCANLPVNPHCAALLYARMPDAKRRTIGGRASVICAPLSLRLILSVRFERTVCRSDCAHLLKFAIAGYPVTLSTHVEQALAHERPKSIILRKRGAIIRHTRRRSVCEYVLIMVKSQIHTHTLFDSQCVYYRIIQRASKYHAYPYYA